MFTSTLAPHISILDMVSGIIIGQFSNSAKYRHSCAHTRDYIEATTGFDFATIQQAIASPTIGLDKTIVDESVVMNQCRRALMFFDPQVEGARIKSKAHNHVFAWPDTPNKNTDVTKIPMLPTAAYVSPLTMVIQPLLQRYYHAAVQWRAVVDKPLQEEESGVVIYIDQLTLGIGFEEYVPYIPSSATSITVLAGPLCAKAYLKTGQLCNDYANALVTSLAQQFPNLNNTGFQGGPGVTYQLAASTAAISSRCVLSQLLICAPHTTTCYLPALSRTFGSSIVLEDPNWNKAIDFFTITGHRGWVTVNVLSSSAIPALVQVQPPYDPSLATASKEFTYVNDAVNQATGYPINVVVPQLLTDAQLLQSSDYEIIDAINNKIGFFDSLNDVKTKVFEQVPSLTYVQDAYNNQRPIKLNVDLGYSWSGRGRIPELALDVELALGNNAFSANYLSSLGQYRRDSLIRIKQDYQEEDTHHRKSEKPGEDPGNVFEIKCPVGSNVYTVNENFGQDRRRRMVSVDARTFKFGETLTRACSPESVATTA